ncbi:hypothetical protein RN001_011386 [Aquatica leii]|uniref:Uncharacterized protein n=1 Tax=Aquatica leii TaxID=1421715 RepID=A0AAN7SQR8_9COLE|nr:hypothetical protein RN001_011386 [Aquatica leii]
MTNLTEFSSTVIILTFTSTRTGIAAFFNIGSKFERLGAKDQLSKDEKDVSSSKDEDKNFLIVQRVTNMLFQRILFALIVYASLVLSKKLPDNVTKNWDAIKKSYYDTCVSESNASKEDLSKLYDEGYLPKTKETRCYLKCIFVNLKYLKSDGDFDLETLIANEPYITNEMSKKCADEASSESDLCEKSYVFGSCILNSLVV